MKMQIVSCPHCGTFLLNDTTECHGCGHVLGNVGAHVLAKPSPADGAVQDDMENCSACGEACRIGLVRCWNCSTFLRPEIEASYRRMLQSGRHEAEHVELPILEASSVTEQDSLKRRVSTPESYLASHPYAVEDNLGGDDFELSEETQFDADLDADDTFDVDQDLGIADETARDSESNEEQTFHLQIPPDQSLDVIEPLVSSEPPLREEPPVREIPPVRAEPPTSEKREELAESRRDEELLKIAADEEKDIQRVRKSLRTKDTFLIYCPQGCRIRVKEKHRGKSGKCPRCQSEFVVPKKPLPKSVDADAAPADPVLTSRYKKWLTDIRLHTVDPQKLRIKADSLLNEFQAVDLGFSTDDLLLATLVTAAGMFGANLKKKPQIRQAMVEHFAKQGRVEQLVVATKKLYSKELLAQFVVAQPAPTGTESLFGDIPVFGANRIAVRIPKLPEETHPQYLSFSLSEFRAFVEGMATDCGIQNFGANTDLPLQDVYKTQKCHYGETSVQELMQINYYQKDPGFKLEISGWRCAACGIVVSETARQQEKLGGLNGKGIAKAKCPKCAQKMGNLPLYQLAASTTEPVPTTSDAERGDSTN